MDPPMGPHGDLPPDLPCSIPVWSLPTVADSPSKSKLETVLEKIRYCPNCHNLSFSFHLKLAIFPYLSKTKQIFYVDDFSYFSGQLEHRRFSRILRTLDENYTSFKPALHEYVFSETQNETRHLVRQPGITTAEQGDIDRFNYDLYYEELKRDAPMLYNAIKGSMAIHFSYQQVTNLVALVSRLVFLVSLVIVLLSLHVVLGMFSWCCCSSWCCHYIC